MLRMGAAQTEQSLANPIDCGDLYKRVAHDATFPDLGAASFELRLYQNDDVSASALLRSLRKSSRDHCGQNQGGRNERNIHDHQIDSLSNLFGREIAGVSFFQQADATILAETKIDLAMPGIHCNDSSGAMLQ